MKINKEMINKNTISYNNLDSLKCDENPNLINIEKKFDPFSLDKNYNYAINIFLNKNELPDINLDLSKIAQNFKNIKDYSVDDLIIEIISFNNYFDALTKNISLNKVESIKEKSIIYYLFYFMSRAFFYIIMNNNFMATKENSEQYSKFFLNYQNIIKACKLYINQNNENENSINNIILSEENNKIKNSEMLPPFKFLKNYPEEFKNAIINCQNFLVLILFSIETRQSNILGRRNKILNKEMSGLMEIFIVNMDILYKVNEYYGIIDYKIFYNDSMSKKINFKEEFINFRKNEKIKKKLKEEKEKAKEKEKEKMKEDNKEDNKIEDKEKDKEKDKNEDKDEEDSDSEMDEEEEEDEIPENKIIETVDKKNLKFTLLDYMWLFNPSAKNEIIILFNEHQRKSEFNKSVNQAREAREAHIPFLFGLNIFVDANEVYLTIKIRRKNLIEDALNELSRNDIKLQNPIKVKFIGEQGVDEGGVRKEFFLLFIRQIFDPNYGMFNYHPKTRLYWFNHYTFEPKIKYELIGIIFGLAIYNNIILDVKFPIAVYKKLLGIKPNLEDMKEYDPELYQNLKFLKENEDPNLKEALDIDFTVIDEKFGEKFVVNLKENGENIPVDLNNKNEYVELFINWFFNESIKECFQSFEKGFYRVFSRDLSKILSPEELELIICGTQTLDFNELKKVCRYEEYTENSETIKDFWDIVLQFNEEDKKKFLSFVTGCDRAPIDGLGSLPITISNGGTDLEQLPSAHTCFNNLILPNYQNKEKLKKNLLTAINYSEGFGLI
jgi:ubiquitin-protein ligase E3 A